jgi:hypothetical protein
VVKQNQCKADGCARFWTDSHTAQPSYWTHRPLPCSYKGDFPTAEILVAIKAEAAFASDATDGVSIPPQVRVSYYTRKNFLPFHCGSLYMFIHASAVLFIFSQISFPNAYGFEM